MPFADLKTWGDMLQKCDPAARCCNKNSLILLNRIDTRKIDAFATPPVLGTDTESKPPCHTLTQLGHRLAVVQ